MEGPYLNAKMAGNLYDVKNPDKEEYMSILESTNCIKRWDASPELPGAHDFARYLRSKGILAAITHTEAEFEDIKEAYAAGFTHAAQFYNAMPGFHKRREYKYEGTVESAVSYTHLDVYKRQALDIPEEGLHKPIDGVSLLPYLSGEKSGNPHEALFWRKMDTRAIRSGSYKLIITRGVDSVLYNMDQDVEEMHDLLSSEPEKARELMEQLSEWEPVSYTHLIMDM